MEYVKLRTRPRSTHTVYRFGGLNHNDEAPVGMTNGTIMRWYDERNLWHDKAPMLSVRTNSAACHDLDGNDNVGKCIAICGGEHLVILNDEEIVYCNGHSIGLPFYKDNVIESATGNFDKGEVTILTDQSGVDTIEALENVTPTGFRTWTFKCVNALNDLWMIGGVTYSAHNLETVFGIVMQSGVTSTAGDTVTIVVRPDYPYASWSYGQPRSIVRMGAWAVIFPENVAVNVVKLAAGTATVSDVVGLSSYWETPLNASPIEVGLTPCRADGTTFSGSVTVSATEPAVQSGIWVDVSGNTTVYREWSATTYSWVVIPEPYVMITAVLDHPTQADASRDTDLKQWDGVKFSTDDSIMDYSYIHAFTGDTTLDDRVQAEVKEILNGSHVLYDVQYNSVTGIMTMRLPGVISADQTVSALTRGRGAFTVKRETPKMDFVVECGNRLWGCYYGPNDDGDILNEIYASVLGDYTNWSVYRGLSTDSWTASRGVAAPFTGAAVLHNSPLFFREESVEKVYPSSSGAHQIQTFDIEGVEKGSWRSLCIIDDRLYYKSRLGVCVHSGTMPVRISDAFGGLKFTDGSAARHKDRYVIAMTAIDGERLAANYDTTTGEWHLETGGWNGPAVTWKDEMHTSAPPYLFYRYGPGTGYDGTAWYAESGVIGYELPEHRFISCVRIRMKKHTNSNVKIYIKYQDTDWQQKANITGGGSGVTDTREINIFPRRCDHFRLKLEGTGPCDILSMSFRMERSEGGH